MEVPRAVSGELLELTQQRLAESPATRAELRMWLLPETANWRTKDAEIAVREFAREGPLSWSPDGRLTKASVITLRS